MSSILNIPSLFSTVTGRTSTKLQARDSQFPPVYFAHGVYDSVKKELIEKGASISFKDKKFPLVWLVTPITQLPHPLKSDAYCELPDVQLFILDSTSADYSEDQNIETCFVPKLRPIYQEFLRQMEASGLFQILDADAITHEMKEWTYQSTTDGKAHLFNEPINCIQIKFKRLLCNPPIAEGHILKHY